jgi:hypothetical protein
MEKRRLKGAGKDDRMKKEDLQWDDQESVVDLLQAATESFALPSPEVADMEEEEIILPFGPTRTLSLLTEETWTNQKRRRITSPPTVAEYHLSDFLIGLQVGLEVSTQEISLYR